MCGKCLEGLLDPLCLVRRMQDPTADMRLNQAGSAILRIGPVASADVTFGRGIEPVLRLRSLTAAGDTARLPSLVEEYLASAGIALHVWGDERLPRRAFLWRMVEEVEGLEVKSEVWSRASVRMGNLHSLLSLAASELPVEESWRCSFVRDHAEAAIHLYSRTKEHRPLWRVARSNQAMLAAWIGDTEEALRILDDLCPVRVDRETASFAIKKAMVLCDAGREEECRAEMELVPEELLDARAKRFKRALEAMG
jgi:hypothetical protein